MNCSVKGGYGDINTNGEDQIEKNKTELSDFDITIGHIEDILIDQDFECVQRCFLEKYWEEFENKEENKLIYMNIFQEYTSLIETHLEEKLKLKMAGFCMKTFIQNLIDKKQDLEGEVFEMLFTLSDYMAFKEMILDYRAMKEGSAVDFSQDLQITPLLNQQEPKKSI